MRFSFNFKDSEQTIISKINQAGINKLYKEFYSPTILNSIERAVQTFVLASIENTETWRSLKGAGDESLFGQFGIPKEQLAGKLAGLLEIWSREIRVVPQNVRRFPQTFSLSYKFYAIEATWANVLGSRIGVTINESKNALEGNAPREIPWLEWLLVSGNDGKVSGYNISFKDYSKSRYSRSGIALMIKAKGVEWNIPSAFGGATTNNNFVTRALEELVKGNQSFRRGLTDIILRTTKKSTGVSFDFDFDINLEDI